MTARAPGSPLVAPPGVPGAAPVRMFDHWPTPLELFPRTGGVPGIQYGLILPNHIHYARARGWRLVSMDPDDVQMFVEGPKGLIPILVVAYGKRTYGASNAASLRPMFVDWSLVELSGLPDPRPAAKQVPLTVGVAVSGAESPTPTAALPRPAVPVEVSTTIAGERP